MRQFPFSFLEQPDAAPAGGWPDQSISTWTATEGNQWLTEGTSLFNSSNTVSYGTPTYISTTTSNSCCFWAGGTLAPDGNIYVLGHLEDNMLVINTNTDAISYIAFPSSIGLNPSAHGGAYSAITNSLYFCTQYGIVFYNLTTATWSTAYAYPRAGVAQGFILGPSWDGTKIYYHGFFSVREIMYFDTTTSTQVATGATFTGDRIGGGLSHNNKFFMGGGGGSTNLMTYDVATNTATGITGGASISADQYRNAVQHPNGYMYSMPGYGATNIKKIDPATLTMTDDASTTSSGNWNSYRVGGDGKIYCVGASNLLGIYDTVNQSMATVSISGKYEGMSVGANGDIYCIPWSTGTDIMKIPVVNGSVITPTNPTPYDGWTGRLQPT